MRLFWVAAGIAGILVLEAAVFLIPAEIRIVPEGIPPREEQPRTALLATPTPTMPSPSPTPTPTPIPLAEKPDEVKAIYFTSWSAGSPTRISEAISLIKNTELNAIVIDVKDFTGKVGFITGNPFIQKYRSEEKRIADFPALVSRLHREGIYVIVRIAVFQDVHLAETRTDLAVKDARGIVWRDRKGLPWVEPGSREVWEYHAEIAREAAKAGVDELNFDYIRFPSDGTLTTIQYKFSSSTAEARRKTLKSFFAFLDDSLRGTGAKLSADLFGLTAVNMDDLGIGQVLEDALSYFDFVCPMVYPSHYAAGFNGYKNPAAHPYEVIKYSLDKAVARRNAMLESTSTVAERIGEIRPWLQAFDLGAPYTPEMIRKEIQAVYDAGLTKGWFLWNPSNRYNAAALEKQ